MNTSEKIAAAIKHILDDDRRADRDRIAALERGVGFLNLRVSNEEERYDNALRAIGDLNKQLDELNEKCAALVLEKELARGELVKLRGERDGLVETPAVKQEDQGPWVVTRQSASSVTGWSYYNDPKEPDWAERTHSATRFGDTSIAEAVAVQTNDRFGSGWFVRTLAEARALEVK